MLGPVFIRFAEKARSKKQKYIIFVTTLRVFRLHPPGESMSKKVKDIMQNICIIIKSRMNRIIPAAISQ